MADRDDSEREVMTSLPRSRPVRRSSKRGERSPGDGAQGASSAGATAARATANAKTDAPALAKPKATTTRGPASNGSTAAPRRPRTTPRLKPSADDGKTPAPAAAEGLGTTPAGEAEGRATTHATSPDDRATAHDEPAAADPPRMRHRRKVPAAGYAAPSARADEGGSAVTDLVTTLVLAASELAQIGLDVGRAALRSMIDRLPKP